MVNMYHLPQGQKLSWKPLCLPAEDPAQKFVFVPWRTWHCLCCPPPFPPPHGGGAGINPRRSQKGSQTFPPRTRSSPSLGDFFLPLKVQFFSIRRKHWATRGRANLNGEVGTTLQDCCLTLRTSWLSLWRRIVSYLIRGSTSRSLNRLVRGSPTSEALRGIETQSKRETDAGLLGPGFLWEAGIKSCLQW